MTFAFVLPVTDAVNAWVLPSSKEMDAGETVTFTAVRVTVAVADLVGSATLVAVTTTVPDAATLAGA